MPRVNEIRHRKTIKFVYKHIKRGSTILDLGEKNALGDLLSKSHKVINTNIDLDVKFKSGRPCAITTAFEIFEHLFAPFNYLNKASGRLIASVPIMLWFAKAYWPDDKRDRHYHEFEKKQFDALLERTGWTIKDSELWTAPIRKIGIRPILRLFYKRHYIIYAEK